jgi:hypothetical protein
MNLSRQQSKRDGDLEEMDLWIRRTSTGKFRPIKLRYYVICMDREKLNLGRV